MKGKRPSSLELRLLEAAALFFEEVLLDDFFGDDVGGGVGVALDLEGLGGQFFAIDD